MFAENVKNINGESDFYFNGYLNLQFNNKYKIEAMEIKEDIVIKNKFKTEYGFRGDYLIRDELGNYSVCPKSLFHYIYIIKRK